MDVGRWRYWMVCGWGPSPFCLKALDSLKISLFVFFCSKCVEATAKLQAANRGLHIVDSSSTLRQTWSFFGLPAGASRFHRRHLWWVDETDRPIQRHLPGRDGSHWAQPRLQHGSLLPSHHQRGDIRCIRAARIFLCHWPGWWVHDATNWFEKIERKKFQIVLLA